MSTEPAEIADAEKLGASAYAADRPMSTNPFSVAQGSLTRVLAVAFRRGYRRAQLTAEEAGQA